MMELRIKMIFRLILFSISFSTNVSAQKRQAVIGDMGHEKIYIHFDRPYYSAGETIWFKAYLYNNELPSLLSHELYLQLEDGSGTVIDKKRYPVQGATVTGSITLGDSLPQGYYMIGAITKAIAAEDAGFLYRKNIFIYNLSGKARDIPLKKNISLQFFPESGHLTDRIKTQVAFKATNETGVPVNVKGVIRSDSGGVITAFSSFHDGIGRLSFTPHINEYYFAELEVDGNKYKFPLPAVQASGVYLKITDADSGKIFEITRSKKEMDFFDTVRLVVKMNNDTVFESRISFGYEQAVSGLLRTGKIPSGILHFIVLDKYDGPMAERLSFVNNGEYISRTELTVIKRDSSKKAANSFEIKFADTVQRSFSIAVTDLAAQEFPDKENIYSRLLLTSDLKGYVYNAGYYFEKNDNATRIALDNLMLTHGWTRYNRKNKDVVASVTKREENHYLVRISGIVSESKTGQTVFNGVLSLQIIAEDSSIQSFNVTVDRNGNFKLDSLLFFGNARIYYSYKTGMGKNIPVNVRLNKDSSEEIMALMEKKSQQNPGQENEVAVSYEPKAFEANPFFESKFKQLAPVFLKTRFRRPEDKINDKYASTLFRSSGKLVLDNISHPYNDRSESVIDYILTNIRTVDIYRDEGILVNRKNFSLQNQRNWKVELFIDENVATVADTRSVTMDKVAMIKFYEAGFVGVSSQAPGGAVAIYLKKSEDEQPGETKNTEKFLSFQGYSVTQEFYHPDYSISSSVNAAPDNRITLYWDTGLQAGIASDKMKFSFYNNDLSKKLSIIIEGFDALGRLFHFEKPGGE